MNSADLVAQLRSIATYHAGPLGPEARAELKAADRIEALEAWKAEVMEVLRPFSQAALDFDTTPDGYPWRDEQHIIRGISAGDLRAARRLVEKEDGR